MNRAIFNKIVTNFTFLYLFFHQKAPLALSLLNKTRGFSKKTSMML